MNEITSTELKNTLWQMVSQLNEAWINSKWEILEEYFDPNVIMSHPGLELQINSREELIKSYKDFVGNATIVNFNAFDPVINIWRNTAMIKYNFTIQYIENEIESNEKGVEIFFFSNNDDSWKIVWRTLITTPIVE